MEEIKAITHFLSSAFENRHYKQLFKNIKACYLVDYENVHQQGLSGMQYLPKHSVVCLFYTQSSDTISIETARISINGNAKILFFKVEAGQKNSLDFQLATFLGYLIAKHQSMNIRIPYYIISKDAGFHSIANFWHQLGIQLQIQNTIIPPEKTESSPIPILTAQQPEEPIVTVSPSDIPMDFMPLSAFLKDNLQEESDHLLQLAMACDDKVIFRDMVIKAYGENFAVQWYKMIKKHLPYRNKKSAPS